MPPIKLALINATGRQSASLARAASAVGFHLSAHITSPKHSPLVAEELETLPHTTVHTGPLSSTTLLTAVFKGADLAFINTTYWDIELRDGRACADAAKAAGVKFIVYSSMPDHAEAPGKAGVWHGLPHYWDKWKVEKYIRGLKVPAAFIYTGIYHNNFTSLPYPLFCLREVPWDEVTDEWEDSLEGGWVPERDGKRTKGRKCAFEWRAPFPKNVRLPWLDSEHDVGPAVLQIFKDGPKKWAGKRVPVAFALMDPEAVCAAFSRGLNRPVRYVEAPIEINVPIPTGYREQLDALQSLFGGSEVGGKGAPYWWEGLFDADVTASGSSTKKVRKKTKGAEKKKKSKPQDEEAEADDEAESHEDEAELLKVPRKLWAGWRDIEGYARDVFPVEEKLNHRIWMDDESEVNEDDDDNSSDDEDEGKTSQE